MQFLIRSAVILCVVVAAVVCSGLPGGLGDQKAGDDHAQQVANSVKSQVQARLGANSPLDEYVVDSYKVQIVAGRNYFLKIRIAPNKYIHARVFEALPHANAAPTLAGLETDKQQNQEITYVNAF